MSNRATTDHGTWLLASLTAPDEVAYRALQPALPDRGETASRWLMVARHWADSSRRSYSTTWWGGTAKASSAAGATAKVTFTGRQFTWIGLKAANRGKAQVFVNGVLSATVDLYNATQQGQRVVWGGVWGSAATRTVTIKVLGTAGRPRVDVDGFFVGN